MSIFFEHEDIKHLIFLNLDLRDLVILKNVNQHFRKECILLINSRTNYRKRYLIKEIQSYNIKKKENLFSKIFEFIYKEIENNKIEKLLNIFEFISYKIIFEYSYLIRDLSKKYDPPKLIFMIWERIVMHLARKYKYSWINADPFFNNTDLNKELFNIYTIPFIIDDLKNKRNPWKKNLFDRKNK